MKAVQILTQESIEKIESAIEYLTDLNAYDEFTQTTQVIEDLKAILTDVRE